MSTRQLAFRLTGLTTVVLAFSLVNTAQVFGQAVPSKPAMPTRAEMAETFKALGAECEPSSRLLAEVRLTKLRKRFAESKREVTPETVDAVLAVSKQQCVSVQVVLMLRSMKSLIPAKDAAALDLDAEIDKHLSLIERSL